MADEATRAAWRERNLRRRLRKRGELAPFKALAYDLYAGAVKVTTEDGDYCLEWTRARNHNGYGRVQWGGHVELAHRCSLEVKLERPLLPGMWALHTCDNPPCIRQEHLFEGTPKENTDDMTAKQRAYWQAVPVDEGGMPLTRAQAKRAVEWEQFKARPRLKRKDSPRCVTCGAQPSFDYRQGEPAYDCRHPAMRIPEEVMERARATFGG